MQRGDDAECRLFQAMADQGHYRAKGGTRQGIYVATAAGALLRSINALEADPVLATLAEGLAAWQRLAREERSPAARDELAGAARWEVAAPLEGLILRSYARDLPGDPASPEPRAPRYNRDHVWFSADEVRELLPKNLEPGARVAWPPRLVHRLVAFHLNDSVHGQCLPFAVEEVAGSELWTEVRGVDARRAEVVITGVGHASGDATWRMGENDWKPTGPITARGVDTRILGRATFDREKKRFVEWEMVAVGRWRGHSGVNGRAADGAGNLGFALRLAPADAPPIPPAFIDVYGPDWAKKSR